jgi:hypothetical protein
MLRFSLFGDQSKIARGWQNYYEFDGKIFVWGQLAAARVFAEIIPGIDKRRSAMLISAQMQL